jgi:hypothetical protein
MSGNSGCQIIFHRNVSISIGPERTGVRSWIIFPADGPLGGSERGKSDNIGCGGSFRKAVQDAQAAVDRWLDRKTDHCKAMAGLAPQRHPEIVRARLLVARSKVLGEMGRLQHAAVAEQIARAVSLKKIASELLSAEVQDTLIGFPQDGAWMPGSGPYSRIINDMLDGGSLLIEEDDFGEDDEAPWRVRLTREAIQLLA